MKYHLLGAIALGLAASANAAFAADDADTMNVQTTVGKYCTTLASTSPTPLALGALTDTDGRVVTSFLGGDTTRDLGAFRCNSAATVILSAEPLTQTLDSVNTDTQSFTKRVDYTANVEWNAFQNTVNSVDDQPATLSTSAATTGNVIVSVSNPTTDGNRRPIAGAYAGQVTLTVTLP